MYAPALFYRSLSLDVAEEIDSFVLTDRWPLLNWVLHTHWQVQALCEQYRHSPAIHRAAESCGRRRGPWIAGCNIVPGRLLELRILSLHHVHVIRTQPGC
jgi:hypothetical protein